MEKHTNLDDATFVKQFEDGTLDPSIFSHEAHMRLAWIHIRKYGTDQACKNICHQILQFDIKNGKGEKFHKTITVAAVKVVNHFLTKSKSETFDDFIKEFPRLKNQFKSLLDYHYGFDIYNSELARDEYIEPDLCPF